jgi:bis(5'-nucleosyl)-tetraphosphatase (symmetrical)
VWGGRLTAVRLGLAGDLPEVVQVDCEQAQQPG